MYSTEELLLYPPEDVVVKTGLQSGFYEYHEQLVACSYLRRGDVAVDVGANVGMWSIQLARAVGKEGKVLAFEPHLGNRELLVKNIQASELSNVTVYPFALGNYSGNGNLYEEVGNAGGYSMCGSGECLDVAVNSLDNILENSQINFLKVDVQGWEVEVLKGGKNLINKQESMGMVVECWDEGLKKARSSTEELVDLLTNMGFTLHVFSLIKGTDGNLVYCLSLVDKKLCVKYSEHEVGFYNLWCIK